MPQTITGIDVELTDKQRLSLLAMAPGARPSEALSGLATSALQDLAGGGVVLTPGTVSRLANSIDDPFDEQQIIDMVEKGARRFGASQVVEYTIDPIYITPMEEWAKSNGRTMQSLVQDCMAIAFEQGWFYEIPPHKTLALTEKEYETIRAVIGREVLFGRDVAEFVSKANATVVDKAA